MKHYLRILSIPLLFLILYASMDLIWHFFHFPSTEVLTGMVKGLFDQYGLPILLLSSIIEGMLLIGGYFPGVFVIFLGVILSNSIRQAAIVVAVATLGLMIAHVGNYILGRYGWYKLMIKFGLKGPQEQAKERLEKRGPIAILLSYWLPSIGALTDTAAGIIQLPFRTFIIYSLISAIFWDTLAGAAVYITGQKALAVASGGTGSIIVYSIVAVWILIVIVGDYWKKKSAKRVES